MFNSREVARFYGIRHDNMLRALKLLLNTCPSLHLAIYKTYHKDEVGKMRLQYEWEGLDVHYFVMGVIYSRGRKNNNKLKELFNLGV